VSKKIQTSKKNKFPKGWNDRKVRALIRHYENQTDAHAAAEDDELFDASKHTVMTIPLKLVPAVRKLLKKKAG
jgi:hypothetical protein